MNRDMFNHYDPQKLLIPEWLIKTQCAIFAILWTITMLPNVLIFRNAALIIGAIIGVYVVIRDRDALMTKRSIPLVIIGSLFIWVTLHLLFIGKNHSLQWDEYQSLWKRAFLGSLFTLGLGLSLINSKKSYWVFIFAGICGPVLIYYLKYLIKLSSGYFGFSIPEAMVLYTQAVNSFYIPKISYVLYCLPALAIAFGCLAKLLKSKDINWIFSFICIMVIMSVLGIFYLENIKNGFLYAFLLTLIFFISLFSSREKKLSFKGYFLIAILGFVILFAVFNNLQTNNSWKTLIADSKVAMQMQPEDVWIKTTFNYPLNENGQTVSLTNFDRIFYLSTAVTFVKQYPLGYGLVHSSFGHIARESYPNAPLIQSHSGWMDLVLGLGIPGAAILLVASILAMLRVSSLGSPWGIFGVWSFLSVVLLFLTPEVSQKNFVDTYVWLVVLVASLGLSDAQGESVTHNLVKYD